MSVSESIPFQPFKKSYEVANNSALDFCTVLPLSFPSPPLIRTSIASGGNLKQYRKILFITLWISILVASLLPGYVHTEWVTIRNSHLTGHLIPCVQSTFFTNTNGCNYSLFLKPQLQQFWSMSSRRIFKGIQVPSTFFKSTQVYNFH